MSISGSSTTNPDRVHPQSSYRQSLTIQAYLVFQLLPPPHSMASRIAGLIHQSTWGSYHHLPIEGLPLARSNVTRGGPEMLFDANQFTANQSISESFHC